MSDTKFDDLILALAKDMDADEFLAAIIKGEISAAISTKRQDLGLSQKEFGERMGVTQGMVSRWESGEENFTIDTLVSIAQKLDLKMRSPFALPGSDNGDRQKRDRLRFRKVTSKQVC